MILVFSSGKQVHKGVIQNYMAFLLIIISFTIFGVHYVGKFIKEVTSHFSHEEHVYVNVPGTFHNNVSYSGHRNDVP
jgi:hypothetical protein